LYNESISRLWFGPSRSLISDQRAYKERVANFLPISDWGQVRYPLLVGPLSQINELSRRALSFVSFVLCRPWTKVHRYFIYGQFTSCLLSPILFSSAINRSTYNTLSSFEPKFSSRDLKIRVYGNELLV